MRFVRTSRRLLLTAVATLTSLDSAFAQDECVTATPVFDGANGPFTNVGSTTNPAQLWTCAFGDNDVWFAYLASCTGNAVANTCGGGFDTVLEVFSGGCGALTSIDCNDDACGLQSQVGWSATIGTTYYIRVGGYAGATGNFPLTISCTPPPPNTLTTTFANDNGGTLGGAVYFELTCTAPAGLTITDLDLNFSSAAGTVGSIDLYLAANSSLPITQPWGLTSSGPATSAGPGLPSNVVLTPPVRLGLGCTVGVALVANGLAHAYTNGSTFPQVYSTPELTLSAGQASNVPFTGAALQPRIVNTNIRYTNGGTCPSLGIATVTAQGAGCDASFASFYQEMAPAAFDLSGGSLMMNHTGSGYTVQFAPGVAPVAVGLMSAPTALALTDDSQIAAGTLGLRVGSNGWVALGAGNSNAFTPAVATLLGNPATAFYSWKDLNPSIVGSGQVQYEEAAPNARVTFDGVWSFGGTSAADANTIQFTYNATTGDMVMAWGPMAASGTNVLVGYSPGGPSATPSASDISGFALNPLTTGLGDVLPLSLTGVGRPVQGAAAVPFQVTTGNIPAAALLHVGVIGLSRPGLPLAPFGAPGCFLDASLDVLQGPAVGPFGGSFTWTALNLPALPPIFSGFEFHAQGAVLGVPNNTALGIGVLTSNGLKCVVGTL